jgi:phospholipid transport system substrate-binding protein
MTSLRAMFGTAVGVSFLALQVNTWAADSPLEVIRSAVNKAMAVLQNPSYQGATHRQERMAKVQGIILPHFDTQELAARVLGLYWHQRTDEEKREFVRLFTDLIEQIYSGTFDRYGKDVQVVFDQEHIDDGFAEVDTQVLAPSQAHPISINYFLHEVKGQWLIYDVQIDNVSMVRNYRNQFSRILSTSSYADLIRRIKDKLQGFNTATS